MTFTHLIGGCLYEVHPVTPLSFGTAAVGLPAGAPTRHFVPLARPQYQSHAGSCVAHGYTLAAESDAVARTAATPQMCRQDLYFGARALEGNGAESRDGGSYPSLAREWLRDYGTVSEILRPYDPNIVTTWRPPHEWDAQRRLTSCDFQPTPISVDAVLAELAADRAIVFCHAVYAQMVNLTAPWVETGPDGGGSLGGHCRALIGYDVDERMLYCHNSWKGWGMAHPTDAAHTDSVSAIPFGKFSSSWIQDCARLVKGLPVE